MARHKNKPGGYVWKAENGKLHVQKCSKCRVENRTGWVGTGICAWCGYRAKAEDVTIEIDSDSSDTTDRKHRTSTADE